jgi:hypothetical protein
MIDLPQWRKEHERECAFLRVLRLRWRRRRVIRGVVMMSRHWERPGGVRTAARYPANISAEARRVYFGEWHGVAPRNRRSAGFGFPTGRNRPILLSANHPRDPTWPFP